MITNVIKAIEAECNFKPLFSQLIYIFFEEFELFLLKNSNIKLLLLLLANF